MLGIGDDAAAWQPSRSHLSVITTDALVDGVHFRCELMSAEHIGHRAMAANLSDIAAMGARPVLVTIALGVPAQIAPGYVLDLYRGMQALAARHGARIVGGDITRAPVLTLALTVVGEVRPSHLCRRDAGRPGDVVAVTGMLGASRAGLELLNSAIKVDPQVAARASSAFSTPEPRVAEGRWLAASVNVHAMMDCSDGLSTDLGRLAVASDCGAVIEDVPIDPAANAIASAAGALGRDYALHGGEDFELIVTIAPRAFNYLAARFQKHFRRPLLRVGRLERQPGLRLAQASTVSELLPAGWDHLREARVKHSVK
ncbi:MAG TPA: thiamine-phosphate kinase [Candidatus Baltobacteraceae bacterium]